MQTVERLEPGDKHLDPRRLDLEHPESLEPQQLRQIIREASHALAFLDAVRLEELALSCWKLTRNLDAPGSATLVLEAQNAAPDLAVFTRVLDATRVNLEVMCRLRDLREGRLEFSKPENFHGQH